MRRRSVMLRLSTLVMLCALAGAGCRRAPRAADTDPFLDDDILSPHELGGDPGSYRLGSRTEDGIPVTGVQFDNVQFAYDSFQIANSEIPTIDAVGQYLQENPDVRLVLEGHCDERGSREYNMSLGEYRALAVRAHLIGVCKIDGARIQTRSYGEEQPLDPGHNESAWRLNRRVEFALFR